MPFPYSISGRIIIGRAELTQVQNVMDRLRDALIAQTVDHVFVFENEIEFLPHKRGSGNKPRPEGGGWMFSALGECSLFVSDDGRRLSVDYCLDCLTYFVMVTGVALAAGLVIGFHSGDRPSAIGVSLWLWILMFASGYLSKTIEFRGWIRANLTSDHLPPVKRLSVPHEP